MPLSMKFGASPLPKALERQQTKKAIKLPASWMNKLQSIKEGGQKNKKDSITIELPIS
jgi:hypothetical protein